MANRILHPCLLPIEYIDQKAKYTDQKATSAWCTNTQIKSNLAWCTNTQIKKQPQHGAQILSLFDDCMNLMKDNLLQKQTLDCTKLSPPKKTKE
jgi:hypothetical protein